MRRKLRMPFRLVRDSSSSLFGEDPSGLVGHFEFWCCFRRHLVQKRYPHAPRVHSANSLTLIGTSLTLFQFFVAAPSIGLSICWHVRERVNLRVFGDFSSFIVAGYTILLLYKHFGHFTSFWPGFKFRATYLNQTKAYFNVILLNKYCGFWEK